MKARLNGYGELRLERGGKMKVQLCPFQPNNCACGDWCPLFLEPNIGQDEVRLEWACGKGTTLTVNRSCFEDERKASR